MSQEIITEISIKGVEYNASIEFDYTPPEKGNGPASFYGPTPDIDESFSIVRVQLEVAENIWATLDSEYEHVADQYVWAHIEKERENDYE